MPLPRLLLAMRKRWLRHDVRVWYSPAYRLPLAGLSSLAGMEPRRADYAAWYLLDHGLVSAWQVRRPRPISYDDLARVHSTAWLESLSQAETLATVFPVSPEEIPVDELMRSIRLACGATAAAAESALRRGGISLNLLGGFHHAGVARGTGFCPVNDIAVAVARLRAGGFSGRVAVLDLDAHPPDGTADCLGRDPQTWIGSISGVAWEPLHGVDETVLPGGTGDTEYMKELEALLARMPPVQLAFVIAGGDVLRGDALAPLAMTLEGVRERDLRVLQALRGVPSAWLPGGGYGADAWRALAGTGAVLCARSRRPVPRSYDPLDARFRRIARRLDPAELGDDSAPTEEDVAADLGLRPARNRLLLGYYTAEGVEYALHRYGVLGEVRRLGYGRVRLATDATDVGDRVRVFGTHGGTEHMLVEMVLERRRCAGEDVLFVHWLGLRHPAASFDARRRRLPGQDAPGLGLARELGEVLAMAARRLRV